MKKEQTMLTVGDRFPEFKLQAVVGPNEDMTFQELTSESHPGQWKVVFFWPMDFTAVCPTEITEFGRQNGAFHERNTQVLGVSTDTHHVHRAWRKDNPMLADLPFPMLADTKKELSSALGIVHKGVGVAYRATFIVDPGSVIRWVNVNDLSVGRSVDETLRVLDALQTGEPTACGWKRGEATLKGKK
jgi:lipoyl-dependent peroxiredoxin subunit C